MRVEARNGMFYDDDDPDCGITFAQANGKQYAFVQAIDTGATGSFRFPKRYWGEWNSNNPAASMELILLNGDKWPDLPGPLDD